MTNQNEMKRNTPSNLQAAGQEIQKRPQTAFNTVPETASGPIQITESSFKTAVLESALPVLVNFWAPWAGPCRMLSPVVDEVAQQYEGMVKVVKINTDENAEVASQYGIRSIPTLMIFKGGQRVDMIVGSVPKTTISNILEKYL